MYGVLGIAVAEVVLNKPEVMALVGQVVAAGVPERVRMDAGQAGTSGREAHEVAYGLAGERLAAFGQEQPGPGAFAHRELAPDRAVRRQRSAAARTGRP
jgi:hypothetical protein